MIKCAKCGFVVNSDMKFALMQNVCPSCGEGLLSHDEVSQLKLLQTRLSERFETLSSEQKYDISLFTFKEIRDGLGRIYSLAAVEAFRKKLEEEGRLVKRILGENPDGSSIYEEEQSLSDSDLNSMQSSIRKEVEKELAPAISKMSGSNRQQPRQAKPISLRQDDDDGLDDSNYSVRDYGDEDLDAKVQRLQAIAAANAARGDGRFSPKGPAQIKAKMMDEVSSSSKIRRST